MTVPFNAGATTATLDTALAVAPDHLRPILQAVRDRSAAFLFVGQSPGPFRIPSTPRLPAIAVLGDDFETSHGPSGFHPASTRRLIRQCSAFAVVSSAPPADLYAEMVDTVMATGRNVLIVETRPLHEIPWVELVRKHAPRKPLILATVKAGRA